MNLIINMLFLSQKMVGIKRAFEDDDQTSRLQGKHVRLISLDSTSGDSIVGNDRAPHMLQNTKEDDSISASCHEQDKNDQSVELGTDDWTCTLETRFCSKVTGTMDNKKQTVHTGTASHKRRYRIDFRVVSQDILDSIYQ